ncbi:hypothetical protein EK21DRAFT_13692, partial [Setomelanomma holmii]
MCNEYKTTYIYVGDGCKIGSCNVIKYTADPCADKPAGGIRLCHNYKMIYSG